MFSRQIINDDINVQLIVVHLIREFTAMNKPITAKTAVTAHIHNGPKFHLFLIVDLRIDILNCIIDISTLKLLVTVVHTISYIADSNNR